MHERKPRADTLRGADADTTEATHADTQTCCRDATIQLVTIEHLHNSKPAPIHRTPFPRPPSRTTTHAPAHYKHPHNAPTSHIPTTLHTPLHPPASDIHHQPNPRTYNMTIVTQALCTRAPRTRRLRPCPCSLSSFPLFPHRARARRESGPVNDRVSLLEPFGSLGKKKKGGKGSGFVVDWTGL